MGLLNFFKKKVELTEEQQKWNKMWDLWVDGKVESPYAELMTYQSELNNGGHDQYFFNKENLGASDLQTSLSVLGTVLSKALKDNLQKAYEAHLILDTNEGNEQAEEIISQCDYVFYEYEKEINKTLQAYAAGIEL